VALTIVGRSRGDVSSHQDIFQTFRFSESQDRWFFEDVAQLWMFCMVVQCFRAMLDKLLSARYVMTTAKLFASNASAPMNKLHKMAWGTEISSEKEGLQQCGH
jgi:hypothetical protein